MSSFKTMLSFVLSIVTVYCKLYKLGHQSVALPDNGTRWTLRGHLCVMSDLILL